MVAQAKTFIKYRAEEASFKVAKEAVGDKVKLIAQVGSLDLK